MSKPIISIIIPVYNAEKYIQKCLDSILHQKYSNYEILIINDGSTDSSLSIIRKYKNKNIKVIDKKNEGVSAARNIGLEKANGKYIYFVDSDDYLEKNCLELAMKYMQEKDLDILKFAHVKELNKYKKSNKFSVPADKIYQHEDYKYIYKFVLSTNDFCNVWNCIIKKEIIKKIKFNTKITFGEDFLFFVQVFLNSKKIMFINEKLYHYTVNSDSITHRFDLQKNIKLLLDGLYVNKEISQLVGDNYKKIWKNNALLLDNLDNCIYNCNYKEFNSYRKLVTETLNNKQYNFFIEPHSKLNKLMMGKYSFYIIEKVKLLIKKIVKKIYGGK